MEMSVSCEGQRHAVRDKWKFGGAIPWRLSVSPCIFFLCNYEIHPSKHCSLIISGDSGLEMIHCNESMILKLISEILAWALLVFKKQQVHFTWARVTTEVHDCPESICTVTAVLMRGNRSFSEIWLHKTLILDTKLDSYSDRGTAEKFYWRVLLLLLYLSLGYAFTRYTHQSL